MYNWLIINAIGFFTGVISSLCINFVCKILYPSVYNHHYGIYVTVHALAGSYMGYTVCEWYKEQVARYYRSRQRNLISAQWILPDRLNNLCKSQCLKKISDAIMD